jgi:hypothetical protein
LLPAFESLYGPIDRNLGHFRRYSKRAWGKLAESVGFRVRHSRYFNSLGFLGWWVNARILRRERQSESQIELFDRFLVPVLSRLERMIEPPFGQSIFSVLETAGAAATSTPAGVAGSSTPPGVAGSSTPNESFDPDPGL